MGVFKRLKDITMATVNGWLEKAEDPVKMLDQYLADMARQISNAEVAVAKQIAVAKRLRTELDKAQQMLETRQKQAMQAVQAGNDELARKALEDKKTYEEKVRSMSPTVAEHESNTESLKRQLQEMKEEYQKMRDEKQQLVAKAQAAKAKKEINQVISGIGKNDSAAKGFERMRNKVEELEAQAEASVDLSSIKSKSLDDEFAALGVSSVDVELQALKSSMASGASTASTESTDAKPVHSEIDDELANLKKQFNQSE